MVDIPFESMKKEAGSHPTHRYKPRKAKTDAIACDHTPRLCIPVYPAKPRRDATIFSDPAERGIRIRRRSPYVGVHWQAGPPVVTTEAIDMYFLNPGSSAHLRWLRVFEPLMLVTGIVQPLAALPSISKLYFTHTQHASGESFTTWSILPSRASCG
jgi:hypothetical protein